MVCSHFRSQAFIEERARGMAPEKEDKSPEEASQDFSETVFLPNEEQPAATEPPVVPEDSRTFMMDSEVLEEQDQSQTVNLQASEESLPPPESVPEDSRTFMMDSEALEEQDQSQTVSLQASEESSPPPESVPEDSRTFMMDSEVLEEQDQSQTVNLQASEESSPPPESVPEDSRTFMMDSEVLEEQDQSQTVSLQALGTPAADSSSSEDNLRTFMMDSDDLDDPANQKTIDSQSLEAPVAKSLANEDNLRTLMMDSAAPDEHPGSRTIDSRTINMDALGDQERKIWQQAAAQDQKQTRALSSNVDLTGSASGPAMESNLLLLSRRLHERSSDTTEPQLLPDYEILRVLGRGGMGVVYEARQASLDRAVAIKVIQTTVPGSQDRTQGSGRLNAAQKLKREQFLSEAVVTGDLDHPNIVPIYDVARTHEGDLFYSMKRVEGTPWNEVIKEKSLDENLDILLKVTDAVAFAHSRGVVHRDIKPENVMLGEFGAVMLMDWGLALPTPEFRKLGTVRPATSLGGSPAYMAPELAIGPIPSITAASDVYLLGAVLYQIMTGRPPHTGSGMSQCLLAAIKNIIEPVPVEKQGELFHIAMKAMATQPSDRYRSVQEMQTAIRGYRSHTESINLSKRAAEDVDRALKSNDYGDYARAVFGYEEALELWNENTTAREGIVQARLAYAEAAGQKEDFDLGLSLLDEAQPAYQPMISLLKHGQTERSLRRSRLVAFRRVAAALLAVIFIGGGGMSWKIFQTNQQLTEAVGTIDKANQTIEVARTTVASLESNVALKQQELRAEQEKVVLARTEAAEKIKVAENESNLKIKQAQQTAELKIAEAASQVKMVNNTLQVAQTQLRETVSKVEVAQAAATRAAADAARAEAEAAYVNYASAISQARGYLDQNQHGQAYQILKGIQDTHASDQPLSWEWQRLWYEANRARRESSTAGVPVDGRDVQFSSSGRWALATYDDGGLELISMAPGADHQHRRFPLEVSTIAAAISPNENLIAAAGNDGMIRLLDRESGSIVRTLKRNDLYGATGPTIHVVEFLTDGLLLSGSQDATIRLWEINTGKEIGICWNLAPVLDLDFVTLPTEQGWLVAAAISDQRNGRVVVWRIAPETGKEQFTRVADLLAHGAPVLTVAFHRDGETVASADQSGRILLWNWKQVGELDYHDRISKAVAGLRTGQISPPAAHDPKVRNFTDATLGSDHRPATGPLKTRPAHRDSVQKLRFSPNGQLLVSASNDLTLKVWNVSSGKLMQTLRGQGGPVRSVDFSPEQTRLLMSAGSGGLFSWDLAHAHEVMTFREEATPVDNQFTAHNDEILSAAFDRSGTRIVTASRDHTARVLEIDPLRQEIRQIADLRDEPSVQAQGHSQGTLIEGGEFVSLSLRTSADQSRLFVGGADGIIRIWNVPRAIEIGSIVGTGLNTSFAISPDGRLVLSGSSDPEARALVWTVNEQGRPQQAPRWKLQGHHDTVTAFAISHDGTRLFTGDRQGMGILWDAQTGQQIGSTLRQHAGSRLNAAVFTENGEELFIAGDNRSVSRVRVATGEVLETLRHDGFVTDLSLAPGGGQLLTVTQISGESETRTRLLLWNLAAAGSDSTSVTLDEEVSRRSSQGDQPDSKREIRSVRFAHDPSLAFSVHVDSLARRSYLKIWHVAPGMTPRIVRGLAFPARVATTETALPGPAGQIFTLNGDAVFLWDLESLGHLKSYRPHAAVTQASFSADGKFIATSSRSVKIWNVATEKTMAQMEFPHEGAVLSVAFSPVPGSYQLLTGGDDGNVKLWNWQPETATVQAVRKFVEQGTRIRRVCFSDDGELILAVGDAGFAKIWRTDGGGTPLQLTDGDKTADSLCCALSPDKHWVVVGSKDRTARLWNLADDLKSARLIRRFTGHADEISDIKFISSDSPANFRIVSASRDTLARVWDPRIEHPEENVSPRELLVLRGHMLGVTAVDTTDQGRLLMSAGLDGEVILWPTRLQP